MCKHMRTAPQAAVEAIPLTPETVDIAAFQQELLGALHVRLEHYAQNPNIADLVNDIQDLLHQDPVSETECLERTGENLQALVPDIISQQKRAWASIVTRSYPDGFPNEQPLPSPRKQAERHGLARRDVKAVHDLEILASRQALLASIGKDATSHDFDNAAIGPDNAWGNYAMSQSIGLVVSEIAAKAKQHGAEIELLLPMHDRSLLVKIRLAVTAFRQKGDKHQLLKAPDKSSRESDDLNHALNRLKDSLEALHNPDYIAEKAAAALEEGVALGVGEPLAQRLAIKATNAKDRLATTLREVPATHPGLPKVIVKAAAPPKPAKIPKVRRYKKKVVEGTTGAADEDLGNQPRSEVVNEREKATAISGQEDIETAINVLHVQAQERLAEAFRNTSFKPGDFAGFADQIRATDNTINKACFFLALATCSGDARAIHDAFATIEQLKDPDAEPALYRLCSQAYNDNRMPREAAMADSRIHNPDLPLPDDYRTLIRPGTAFMPKEAQATEVADILDVETETFERGDWSKLNEKLPVVTDETQASLQKFSENLIYKLRQQPWRFLHDQGEIVVYEDGDRHNLGFERLELEQEEATIRFKITHAGQDYAGFISRSYQLDSHITEKLDLGKSELLRFVLVAELYDLLYTEGERSPYERPVVGESEQLTSSRSSTYARLPKGSHFSQRAERLARIHHPDRVGLRDLNKLLKGVEVTFRSPVEIEGSAEGPLIHIRRGRQELLASQPA